MFLLVLHQVVLGHEDEPETVNDRGRDRRTACAGQAAESRWL